MTATVNSQASRAMTIPPASPADAAAHFAARLALYTDVSDVAAALADGTVDFTLVDTRGDAAWQQAHIDGAVHIPSAELAAADLDPSRPVVVHCWGPGCDGAAKAALALALRGFRVKEMVGGIEYWIREGFPVRTPGGVRADRPDPLTAPTDPAVGCAC
ncbi:rhodanese-like domain-containing protein [Mangrovactinospora gilvigrisea]|nr:rhodanese-like domain-containing protein [Mangrovactinospora gilvigrisea]